ncbi:integrase, catalytic region, zinc finger, CCHC-type containing protein [Tanacetum coccineum]
MEDLRLFTLPCRLGDSKPFDTLADLGSCVNIIPLYLFKKLNIRLLEETGHIFRLADETKSYPIGIVKNVEVHTGKLELLNDFYMIDIKMAKIAVWEGITRSVFEVKGVDLGEEEAPYWTTLGKRDSYKPQPHSDGIGARTPYYARKDFLDCHLPREWEIARDAELNSFKERHHNSKIWKELVLEWEERIKLHLEKEMKFNQWRSNNFKNKQPAPIKVERGMDDEGEVTLYLMRRSLEDLRMFSLDDSRRTI